MNKRKWAQKAVIIQHLLTTTGKGKKRWSTVDEIEWFNIKLWSVGISPNFIFLIFRSSSNAMHNGHKPESFKLELSNKSRKDEAYNPYFERNVEHPLSNNETTIHLLKSSLGTGILAMPKAYYHAGYIVGSIGTIIIGSIAVYCIQLLLKIHYELCKRNKVCNTHHGHYHNNCCFNIRRPYNCCLTGPIYGLPNNCEKCFTGRTTMDAQIGSVYCVMHTNPTLMN